MYAVVFLSFHPFHHFWLVQMPLHSTVKLPSETIPKEAEIKLLPMGSWRDFRHHSFKKKNKYWFQGLKSLLFPWKQLEQMWQKSTVISCSVFTNLPTRANETYQLLEGLLCSICWSVHRNVCCCTQKRGGVGRVGWGGNGIPVFKPRRCLYHVREHSDRSLVSNQSLLTGSWNSCRTIQRYKLRSIRAICLF